MATRLKEMNRGILFSAIVYIPHLPSTITINKSKNALETLARFSKLCGWISVRLFIASRSLTGMVHSQT